MTDRFPEVGDKEELVLTFEFAAGLATGTTPETLTGIPTVDVTVDYGVDAAPGGIIDVVTLSDDDLSVLVAVKNLKAPVDYHIEVTCATSNAQKTLSVEGILPVR